MKKEYYTVIAIILLLIAYGLDQISGPFSLGHKHPYLFLMGNAVSTYPLTALAIGFRAVGLWVLISQTISLIEKQYAGKILFIIFLITVSQLYAIQQMATGLRNTSLQWTISISYSGLLLTLTLCYIFIRAIWEYFNPTFDKKSHTDDSPKEFQL